MLPLDVFSSSSLFIRSTSTKTLSDSLMFKQMAFPCFPDIYQFVADLTLHHENVGTGKISREPVR